MCRHGSVLLPSTGIFPSGCLTGVGSHRARRLEYQTAEFLLRLLKINKASLLSINGMKFDGLPAEIDLLNHRVTAVGRSAENLGRTKEPNRFRVDTFGFSFLWDGQLVKFQADLRREYLTITIWLPAFVYSSPGTGKLCSGKYPIARNYAELMRTVLQLSDAAAARNAQALGVASSPVETTMFEVSRFLYEDIWRRFVQRYWCQPPCRTGGLSAIFRSIILPSKFPHNSRDAGLTVSGRPANIRMSANSEQRGRSPSPPDWPSFLKPIRAIARNSPARCFSTGELSTCRRWVSRRLRRMSIQGGRRGSSW